MRAVKGGCSGGETGQDMTTRHNACVVAAILLCISRTQAATIYVDVNCPGPGDGSVGILDLLILLGNWD